MGKYCWSIFILILIHILTPFNPISLCQDQPHKIEWGEVPLEQLQMTSHESDTNATAIILYDRGDVSMDADFAIIYKRHRRIKILTSAGFNWGTTQIIYYTKKHTESVKDIEGQTLVLNSDGKIIKYELKGKDIFKQKLDEYYDQIKFTLPSLSPGCVIEYRYTIKRETPVIPEWSFQTSEPTLWSEYEIRIPSYFQYAFLNQTYHQFSINKNEQISEVFRGHGIAQMIPMNHSHWAMKNIPALRTEPYVTTLEDYTSKITFQIAAVYWPGENPRRFLESWDKVGEDLMKEEYFGRQLKGYRGIRNQVEQIIDGITDSMKLMEAVYDFVRTTMLWNGYYRVYANKDLDDVFESKSGSCAEINLLLTLMLRDAGLPAKPVILSTRSNGKIQTIYPMVNQFNYVISRIVVNGVEYFLDATDPLRPMELLPYRALNQTGFLIDDKSSSWVTIVPRGKASETNLATLKLQPDGSLFGSFQLKFSEYSGTSKREALEGEKTENFIKALMESKTSAFIVDSFTIVNKDSIRLPLIVTTNVSSSIYTQVLDSFIYMNPMTIDQLSENPFKSQTRYFPVDYAYPISTTYILNLSLPEEYDLKEYPEDFKVILPSNTGAYSRVSQVSGTTYQMMVKIDIIRATFEAREYNTLRNFYGQIVSREAQQLVFKRKSETTPIKSGK